MDIKDLLAQLQELRQSNNQEQKSMDEASMENSEATINPSMFTARKQQELKGLPKEDIQDVVSQTKNYMDPRIADMAGMSGGLASVGRKLTTGVARALEPQLNKLRDSSVAESKIGQLLEKNVRQPMKAAINEADFGKANKESLRKETLERLARDAENAKFDQIYKDKYESGANEAFDIMQQNKALENMTELGADEATLALTKKKK